MTVEVATTIATLDSALPAATDPKSEGDDHIRLIKTVLKANVVSGPASSTDNTIPRFDGTTGKLLQGSGVSVDDSGNVLVGDGTTPASKLHLETPTLTRALTFGSLPNTSRQYQMGLNSLGNFSVYDTAAASEWMTLDTSGNLGVGGVPYQKMHVYGNMRLDNGASAAVFQVTQTGIAYRDLHIDAAGTYHINGAFGYGAGAGGTVTQVDISGQGKGSPVTLNKPSGTITMHNAALGAGIKQAFAFYNSFIRVSDTLAVVIRGPSPIGAEVYRCWVGYMASGACYIAVENITGSSQSHAVEINFAVIKGSTS